MTESVPTSKELMLFIGDAFHNKTKSSQFMKNLLSEQYEIEYCDFDPYSEHYATKFNYLHGREFDVVVLWQTMPDIGLLKTIIHYRHIAFFPMYDAINWSGKAWESYYEVAIICFSRTLHFQLQEKKFTSYYIQYFPELQEVSEYGDASSVFFWQRISVINIDVVERILSRFDVAKIQIHKVLDPNQVYKEPSNSIKDIISYSSWYPQRKDMLTDIEHSSLYIAPRLEEGIGMSFLEAMAMGRCVIAPNNPTMNEYIVHNETGILYDPNDIMPISEFIDVRKIQDNTIQYMRNGFAQWEKEKYRIFDWLKLPVQVVEEHHRGIATYQICRIGKIGLLSISKSFYKTNYYLFSGIRILKITKKKERNRYYLLGFILVPHFVSHYIRINLF